MCCFCLCRLYAFLCRSSTAAVAKVHGKWPFVHWSAFFTLDFRWLVNTVRILFASSNLFQSKLISIVFFFVHQRPNSPRFGPIWPLVSNRIYFRPANSPTSARTNCKRTKSSTSRWSRSFVMPFCRMPANCPKFLFFKLCPFWIADRFIRPLPPVLSVSCTSCINFIDSITLLIKVFRSLPALSFFDLLVH